MKGIVLAGGLGTRLNPLTRVTNKHLLPVYDKPMIFYPLQTLADMGVEQVLLVTGGNSAGDFLKLLHSGQEFGFKLLTYAYQVGEAGIADALRLAEQFAAGDRICVVLGDNVLLGGDLKSISDEYRKQDKGAKIIFKKVPDPHRFGCPVLYNEEIVRIEEKPKSPKSNFAVIGVYFYDSMVFDIIRELKPSDRGEFEITDVNNEYLKRGLLTHNVFDGDWMDCGTFDSLLKSSEKVKGLK